MPIALVAPDRTGHIVRETRATARRVGWSEWGDPTGSPVLFCTGAGMSSSLGFGAEAVRALRLRLICIDRPGLGHSEPDPDKSLMSYAGDVAAVLRHQGIARAPAVGFSQGAPFAVALAAAGVISRLALVAAQDELAFPAMRRELIAEVEGLVDAIEADRDGFEASFAARVDADGLWELILAMSAPVDRAFYEEPGFAAAYRQSLIEGFAQGPHGYVRDLTLAMSRWPTPPEEIGVPVTMWYGELDASPVHSPDGGATLQARFPDAVLHSEPDQGGAILWTCSRAILDDLVAPRGGARLGA